MNTVLGHATEEETMTAAEEGEAECVRSPNALQVSPRPRCLADTRHPRVHCHRARPHTAVLCCRAVKR